MDTIGISSLYKNYSEIINSVEKHRHTTVHSLALTQKLHLLSYSEKKFLYVAGEDNSALVAELFSQLGVNAVIFPREYDPIMFRQSTAMSLTAARVQALADWIEGKVTALIIEPETLTGYLPKKENFISRILQVKEGDILDLTTFTHTLLRMGYQREERAERKGSFSRTGDIFEIFPIDSSLPLRIMTDFDEVSSIKYYQPDTMSTIRKVTSCTILPASDVIIPWERSANLVDEIRSKIGLQNTKASLRSGDILSELELNLPLEAHSSLNWLYPFVKDQLATIFDYLSPDDILVIDEKRISYKKLNDFYSAIKERVSKFIPEGEALRNHYDVLVDRDIIEAGFACHNVLEFSNYNIEPGEKEAGIFVRDSKNIPSYFANLGLLSQDIADFKAKSFDIVMFGGTPEGVDNLRSFFGDNVKYIPEKLQKGFIDRYSKVMVIGVADMNIRSTKKTADTPTRSTIAPRAGDYVVHQRYGIGKCLGIEHIKSYVGEYDYLCLQYAGENKIYLPVHKLDEISLYTGGEKEPKLSNPNKDEFEKEKTKAQNSIKTLAIDLLDLYAKREESKGYKYQIDGPLQLEFEEAFGFEPTPDQVRAIAEIKSDMESGRVMDRLLCGDVGFGKTEVALRAAFKTIMEGKQVAILAPTTILAEQHSMTALERLSPFGIRVGCLTRFRTKEETKAILDGAKAGTISLVIGTHRILSKDVKFADLGLLILDEEQRFGVEQKEKLKLLRTNINVLSMSATPIPRTLDMALSGIRDISVLDTPPKGRQAVRTIVAEYTDTLLKDAIDNEMARNGQTFVLLNSIERLADFTNHVKELLPDARIVTGHGRMDSSELERNIYKFYNKEADVLISTTIIENGVDIPDANTLIVIDADKLGLSQMYQLKGRVGRSTTLASAYFTYPENKVLDGVARRRLEALTDNSELGSGYRLAMMDLEIRGAGRVLGREQHGHVERIGYDMYCRLLKETIAVLKGEAVMKYVNTEVSIKGDAYISETYVKHERERLKLYKRIAEIESIEDKNAILADIEEMYGTVPKPVKTLATISLLRVLGSKVGIVKVMADDKDCKVIFKSADYLESSAVKTATFGAEKKCFLRKPDNLTLSFAGVTGGIEGRLNLLITFMANANGIIA